MDITLMLECDTCGLMEETVEENEGQAVGDEWTECSAFQPCAGHMIIRHANLIERSAR